jgi:F-type H+-transporting ATPase subunit c
MDAVDGINIARAAALFGAGFAIAIGTLGPSIGMGLIAKKGCEMIGKYPESSNKVRMTLLLSISFVEACAVYALLIAFLLIFFGR